jgi:hypothetical protein
MQTYLQLNELFCCRCFSPLDNCLVWHWHSSWQGVPAWLAAGRGDLSTSILALSENDELQGVHDNWLSTWSPNGCGCRASRRCSSSAGAEPELPIPRHSAALVAIDGDSAECQSRAAPDGMAWHDIIVGVARGSHNNLMCGLFFHLQQILSQTHTTLDYLSKLVPFGMSQLSAIISCTYLFLLIESSCIH